MTTAVETNFETWAIVELFGHTVIAGHVSEQEFAGAPMLRVDVPETEQTIAFIRLLNHKAIYSITPVEEKIARKAVEYYNPKPIVVASINTMVHKLAAGVEVVDVDDDDDDDYDGYTFDDNRTRDRAADDLDF